MSTPVTPAVPAKVSWLKRIGSFFAKVLAVVAKDGKPVIDDAAKVAEIVLPQFAPLIVSADNIADNIIQEAVAAEAMEQAGAAAQGGPAKLDAVLLAAGPAIDNWVSSRFPGANKVSDAAKAGLISALVDLVNDVTTPPSVVGNPIIVPPVTPAAPKS